MAWPVLVAVAKAVPWLALVQQAPAVLDAANKLRAKSNSSSDLPNNDESLESKIDAMETVLVRLENHDRETAEVVRQLAEQNQEMATSIEALVAKIKVLGFGLIAATLIAAVALVKVLL